MARAFVRSHGPAAGRALAAVALLLLAAPLNAGPIFVPGQLDGDKFTPTPGVTSAWYSLRYSTAAVTIEDGIARVQIDETIDGPEKAVAAVCLIPLPEGADGTDVRVTLGAVGAAPVVLADATFLTPAKAQALYEAVAKGTGSTKLLAFGKRPAILVPRVALEGK